MHHNSTWKYVSGAIYIRAQRKQIQFATMLARICIAQSALHIIHVFNIHDVFNVIRLANRRIFD